MIAQQITEAISSMSMTDLTIQSAARNRSQMSMLDASATAPSAICADWSIDPLVAD